MMEGGIVNSCVDPKGGRKIKHDYEARVQVDLN